MGYRTSILTIDDTLDFFKRSIEQRKKTILLSINQHSLYVALRDWRFAHLLLNYHAHIDGMPILLLARLAGAKVRRNHRFGGIDLMPKLMSASTRFGWKIFYLGGSSRDLNAGIAKLRQQWPAAHLVGHHGYFDHHVESPENRRVLAAINAGGADVLLVGMSMGPQERWIFDNRDQLDVSVIVTVGATIRYFAGAEPIPPGFLRRSGFEWVYRLAFRPATLWYRYLVEPPLTLLGLVATGRLWNWHKAAGARTLDRLFVRSGKGAAVTPEPDPPVVGG